MTISKRRGHTPLATLFALTIAFAGRAQAGEAAPVPQSDPSLAPAASPAATAPPVTSPAVPPPRSPGAATDREDPTVPTRRPAPRRGGPWPDAEEPARPKQIRNPLWGLVFELGIGGGGDDLVKVSLSDGSDQTLSAGDGVAVSVGLMVTPLWVGDSLGVGVSGTFGYKGWSVGGSNGDISLSRFPLTAAVHVLPRISPMWLLLVRGGIDKEVGVSLSGSGVAAGAHADLNAGLGGFGEMGFYKILETPEQRGAWSLTFRYTKLTYSANGATADAQNFMLFSTLYFNP